MNPGREGTASRFQVLRQLSEGLLHSAGRSRVRGNLLEIHHPSAPLFDDLLEESTAGGYGVSISLSRDPEDITGERVRCSSAQLPFQDRVFSMVVLQHVIGDGDEAELAEAARVLARGGVLLVLGLNCLGWRYRSQDDIRRLPGIVPWRVKSSLEAAGLVMQGFAGAGLAGRPRPAFLNRGLSGLAVPLADLLLLQARHRDEAGVTPLQFRKPRSSVVQSAPMRG